MARVTLRLRDESLPHPRKVRSVMTSLYHHEAIITDGSCPAMIQLIALRQCAIDLLEIFQDIYGKALI